MHYAPANKCNYNDCFLQEYSYPMPACIRKKPYDCMAKAVIPAVTVDSVDGITNLANCFVHVTSINTTYYVDDKHRPMIVWAGDVEIEIPSNMSAEELDEMVSANERGLRSQYFFCRRLYVESEVQTYYMHIYYYDKNGRAYKIGDYEELGAQV